MGVSRGDGSAGTDADFGSPIGVKVMLGKFAFPFSDENWNSFLVGANGWLTFGGDSAGIKLARYDHLRGAVAAFARKSPAICVPGGAEEGRLDDDVLSPDWSVRRDFKLGDWAT